MSLACEVCYEAYASYPSDKVPRIFPRCGHDFCTRCIKIVCSSKDNVFSATCPKCRAFLFSPCTCGATLPGHRGGPDGWCTLGICGPPPPPGSALAEFGLPRSAQARTLCAFPAQAAQAELPRSSNGGGLPSRHGVTGNGTPSSVFFSNSPAFHPHNTTTSDFNNPFFERTSEAVSLGQRLADNAGVLNAIVGHFPVLRCALQLTERLDFNDALHCQGLVPRVLQVATDAMLLREVRKRKQILQHVESRAALRGPSRLQPRRERATLVDNHSFSEAWRVGNTAEAPKRCSGRAVLGVMWQRLRQPLTARRRSDLKQKGKELLRRNVFYVQKKAPSHLFRAQWRLCAGNRRGRSDGGTWGPSGGSSLCRCHALPDHVTTSGFPGLAAGDVCCDLLEASGAWKWPCAGGSRAKPQLCSSRPSLTGCRWCTFSPRLKQRFSVDAQISRGTPARQLGHYTSIRPKCRLSPSFFFGRKDVRRSCSLSRRHLFRPAVYRRQQGRRSCSCQPLPWSAPALGREPLNRTFLAACCRWIGLLWIYGVISARRVIQKCGNALGAMEKEQTLQLVMIANAIPLLLCSFYLFYNPGLVLRLIAPVLAHR